MIVPIDYGAMAVKSLDSKGHVIGSNGSHEAVHILYVVPNK
jgi:hypothetical protein